PDPPPDRGSAAGDRHLAHELPAVSVDL
ncbi:hypothetical protein PD653_5071, partial [Nocardioides sp. PD653]